MMQKSAGIFLWMIGDFFLIRYLHQTEQQKIKATDEMLTFIRNITCDVNEWKLPLEEACARQKDGGRYQAILWKELCRQKEAMGIRKALLSAVEHLPMEQTPKKLLTEYLSQLGKLKKEPMEELYQRVRCLLEEHLKEQKKVFFARQKLTTGFVGGISTMAAILLL